MSALPQVRIWMDGVFDLTHYGHMNAFRQGRALGTALVVGVNSTETVIACKGSEPVLDDHERATAVRACKYVDEVVPHVPYVMTPEYISRIIREYRIDYIVHGNDPCTVGGQDVYASAKALGIYKSVQRTDGVSTTDLVRRMADRGLSTHHEEAFEASSPYIAPTKVPLLRAFSSDLRLPAADARVVYVQASWDLLHAGHCSALQRARALGNFLLVGIRTDQAINREAGANFPIMGMSERVLGVLGSKYVDDVLVGAPEVITEDLIDALNISVVVHATGIGDGATATAPDPYAIPKRLSMYREVDSDFDLTAGGIMGRMASSCQG